MIRLGLRAHDLGAGTIEELADKLEKTNLKCIQLALPKAINNIPFSPGTFSPGLGRYVRKTLESKGIDVAVLGCYINFMHPDLNERKKEFEKFKEHIRFAKEFGALIVGTESGSYNPDFSFNEKNHTEEAFTEFIVGLKKLVKEAEKYNVIIGLEGVTKYVVNTAERIRQVLDIIDSDNLKVILDPINLLSYDNYKEQDEIIKKCFDLFADDIMVIHAKDFVVENNEIREVAPGEGKGEFNYKLLLQLLKKHKPHIEVLMENTTIDTYQKSAEYIMSFVENE